MFRYEVNRPITVEQAIDLYNRSTLGERRPVDRPDIFAKMLAHADVTVTAGEWTLLEFRNEDPVVHDWMVEGIPNLEVIARPGQTETLRFVLDEPGEYMVTCSVPGHAEAGMVGMLTVEAR